jgi:hypothetical protein
MHAPDEVKPWTIKNVPPEERNAAISAAGRANLNIGEWLARAIRTQVQVDRNEERAPAVVAAPFPAPAAQPTIEITDLERLVSLSAATSSKGAATRDVKRMVGKIITAKLKSALPAS